MKCWHGKDLGHNGQKQLGKSQLVPREKTPWSAQRLCLSAPTDALRNTHERCRVPSAVLSCFLPGKHLEEEVSSNNFCVSTPLQSLDVPEGGMRKRGLGWVLEEPFPLAGLSNTGVGLLLYLQSQGKGSWQRGLAEQACNLVSCSSVPRLLPDTDRSEAPRLENPWSYSSVICDSMEHVTECLGPGSH